MFRRGSSSALAAWDQLAPVWQVCFEQAWQSYRFGTVPAGAAVVDARGRIVSRGRNAIYDSGSAPGHLAGTQLAHAEVNALIGLDPNDRYEDHVLYTTSEPCPLCVGAAVMSAVGEVRYASPDLYSGAAGQVAENPHTARLPLRFKGPIDGPFATVGALLRLELYVRLNPTGSVVQAHRERSPDLVTAAERLVKDHTLVRATAEGARFPEVIASIWRLLA